MARHKRMHTVYDMMDEAGKFDDNPANVSSRDTEGNALYKGPIPYPKMMYHPTGETFVSNKGEEIERPGGKVMLVDYHEEIKNMVVHSAEEEAEARKAGWHDHPAKAMAARGDKNIPAMGAEYQMAELERQKRELEQKLADLMAINTRTVTNETPRPSKTS